MSNPSEWSKDQVIDAYSRYVQHTYGRTPIAFARAEASETAIKLARKWGLEKRGAGCFEVITFDRSFHGRTYGALSATGQTKFQKGFEPVVPGFSYAPWDDLEALRKAVGPQTCAV